jgi:hypothetical protein
MGATRTLSEKHIDGTGALSCSRKRMCVGTIYDTKLQA